MSYEILASAIRETGERGDLEAIRAFASAEHPADLAAFLASLDPAESWFVLDLLSTAEQAEIFGYLAPETQVELAQAATRTKLARIVTAMEADERADLFNELSDEQQEALLPALAQAEREDIRRLSSYEEGTAGAIMTSDYAILKGDLSASAAIEKLRHEAPDKETIYRTYVIDEARRLIGSVRLQDLILAPSRKLVREIMETNTLAVRVDEDQESVAGKIARYDLLALPVIDAEGRMVGIVTHDDALDVLQQEATEDFHKVGSVQGINMNVRDAGIFLLYRARIVWLVLLVLANIFSGAGIAYFEDTIAAHVVLMFFLPLLLGSGGNAGSQCATMMVRGLATGDVKLGDWGRLVGREVLVAGLLGLSMALAVSGIGLVRGGTELALVVAAAMMLIVIVGSVIGLTLPFILTRLKFDPATASAPLVTSIADAIGVIIYFSIATAYLSAPAA